MYTTILNSLRLILTMRATCFTRGFLLLALIHSGSFQNQPVCGIPGNTFNGINLRSQTEYELDEEIRYSCPAGWLKGDETRTCLRNGQWSGSIPVCLRSLHGTDLSVAVEAKECVKYKSDEISNEIRTLWTEPGNTLCTRRCQCEDLDISISFKNEKFILDGFELTFPKSDFPKLLAFSIHDESRTLCNISDSRRKKTGHVDTTTVRFDCYSSKKSTGIRLDFQPDKHESLSLCHITPLYHPIIYGCSIPDSPLNGKVQQKNKGNSIGAFDFRCDGEFELVGASSTECRVNGTWSEPSPVCVQKPSVDRQLNGTSGKEPPLKKNFRHRENYYVIPVLGAVIGAGFILILALLLVILYMCKQKSKVKTGKRLHHSSSQRSNSFDIAYRRNRRSTECHSNPDFGPENVERPRSDVPDILENKVLNKVMGQTKRGDIPSAHIYADPVYSEMEDEPGQSGVMMDNVLYNERGAPV